MNKKVPKSIPIYTEQEKQKSKISKLIDKSVGIFLIFILPFLFIFSLYYFRKIYKSYPIIYIIFLILTTIYLIWDLLYIFFISRI
jgi:hypothetical protein